MSGANFPRVHVWADDEDVNASDLNAEFDNILNNDNPAGSAGYEADVTQMQKQTSPGGLGTEVLATSLGGELERLRFVLARMTGTTYWYQAPALSFADINTLLNAGISIPPNRVSAGRVGTVSNQAMALVPSATLNKVSLKAATTSLVFYVAGTRYTVSSDVLSSTLTLASAVSNTCLVNDASLAGGVSTKTQGENGTVITVDTMGTAISALVGQYAAFKVGTEYFIAFVNSTTQLTKAFRGYFFDSSDAWEARVGISDDDTITLVKLTYVFIKTDGTLDVTYNAPVFDFTQPTSPASGDFWFDFGTFLWKKYNGSAFIASGSTLLGTCIQDTTKTVGARTYEYFTVYSDDMTAILELASVTQIRGSALGERINVNGNDMVFQTDFPLWNSTGQFASGVTLQANTTYYLYVSDLGKQVLDVVAPYDRTADLLGYYHPAQSWRAVGYFTTDGSANFTAPTGYGSIPFTHLGGQIGNYQLPDSVVTTAKINDGAVTQAKRASLGWNSNSFNISSSAGTGGSFSLTTTGRPVLLFVSQPNAEMALNQSASYIIRRNGSAVVTVFGSSSGITGGAGSFIQVAAAIIGIDTPAAGTYTYDIQATFTGGTNDVQGTLVAIEL